MKTRSLIALIIPVLALMSCKDGLKNETASMRVVFSDGRTLEKLVALEKENDHLQLFIPKDSLIGIDTLSVIFSFSKAKVGEDGYFVNSQGFQTFFLPGREGAVYDVYKRHPIRMEGVKTPQSCYAVLFDTYRFNMISRVEVKDSIYTNSLIYVLKDVKPYDDLIVNCYPLSGDDADYSGMGRLYRKVYVESNPDIKMLKDKVAERPLLKYAVDNPEIRIRQGWKPVPTPVPEQTRENEPAMRVKVTFDRCCDIVDALKEVGVDSAQLTLVGWNLKGHDGRFPTVFPPEPTLGGENRLMHLISYAQQKGYQIVPHICTGDAYKVSEDWDPNDVAKRPDGSMETHAIYSSVRMYQLCPKVSYEKFVLPINEKLREMGFRGVEYNDVYSIIDPVPCWDPAHPLNPEESAVYSRKILQDGIDKIGGIGSEGGYDHVAGVLDFCLYTSMTGLTRIDFAGLKDAYVPVWHIIYNGYIYSCPFSQTVNYPVKEPGYAMKMQEYGFHPTFYFYSAHRDDAANWIGTATADLLCADDKELKASVSAIKQGYDYLREYGYIQYLTMEDHRSISENVFRTLFSDGTVTVCNYSNAPFEYDGVSIGAGEWHIFKVK